MLNSFQLYKDRKGEYRWRIVAVNGETLADSGEGYHNKQHALHAARLVFDVLEGEKAAGILKGVQ